MTNFAWTATYGEVKSAAEWTELGDNDRALQDGTGIDDGAILPNHLLASASTANNWTWDSFTPTWTNLTVGNGTNTGAYIKIGRTVHVRAEFVLGSTSSVGADPYITLPITAAAYTADRSQVGLVGFNDVGTNSPVGVVRMRSTTTASIFALNASSTYLLLAGVSSTAPFTWTTGDNFGLTMTYQAAS